MANGDVDKKTEYQCTYTYHNDLIKSRYTLAGLYLAATGIVISKIVELECKDETNPSVVFWICLVMVALATICLCLEGRTRFLYQAIGKRLDVLESTLGEEIKDGKQKPLFYFCYSDKEGYKNTPVPLSQQLKSHSLAFRLLFLGSLFCWVIYGLIQFPFPSWPVLSNAIFYNVVGAIIILAVVAVPFPLWKSIYRSYIIRKWLVMRDYYIGIFYDDKKGEYVADMPDLKDFSATGKTPQEALENIKRRFHSDPP